MRRLLMLCAALPALLLAGTAAALLQSQEEPFTHDEHEGLFPLCAGCHSGIEEGVTSEYFPEPESCVNCHDGVQEERVEWSGRMEEADNLRFAHTDHMAEVEAEGEAALRCADCHVTPGAGRMSVDGNPPERCLTCHTEAGPVPEHTEAADCAACHVPLAETRLGASQMDALLVPAVHEGDEFILEGHGTEAREDVNRCATCHVRDQCLSCHVNGSLEPIPAVPPAPEGLPFHEIEAEYPIPAGHLEDGFLQAHDIGAGLETCATCHTQNDCRSCHVAGPVELVSRMPEARSVRAPGVVLDRELPTSHESPFFIEAHAPMASANETGCVTCHTQGDCVACHDGSSSNAFHPANFMARHSASAFGQRAECASCHDSESFCRSCHVEAGFGSRGRLGAGYHDAEPVWLLRHGQAARQTLESCVSCHEQNDCTQCHSVLGAFKVNPHGPGFDAEAARRKNPRVCLACHVTIPGGG